MEQLCYSYWRGGARTHDIRVNSSALCQLSYPPPGTARLKLERRRGRVPISRTLATRRDAAWGGSSGVFPASDVASMTQAAHCARPSSGNVCPKKMKEEESGMRDSNPRPPAWQAGALPAELMPHGLDVCDDAAADIQRATCRAP